MAQNYQYIFVDYEGTLSELPKGSGEKQEIIITDLLFGDVFTGLKPNEDVKQFLLKQNTKNIYVLGVIDTNLEIKIKEKWLKKHYHFIRKNHYLFISGEHKKVEILDEFVKKFKIKRSDILFIDDKQKHLNFALEKGYHCINANCIETHTK